MTRSLLIVDLEATCWEGREHRPENMEIIEIGALLLHPENPASPREFQSFVRPAKFPELSEFCRSLTSIRQPDVDGADPFPRVIERLLGWLGDPRDVRLASWGNYDRKQLLQDCRLHGVRYPFPEDHFNIKTFVAERKRWKPAGVGIVLRQLGLEFEGTAHRGIDDARNIWRILSFVLAGDLRQVL
jgi:inhibitor of KinA sporulation pathway (predicted exonuclease)